MSDELVARLRAWRVDANGAAAFAQSDEAGRLGTEAADRIEALEAERDTLAEMVQVLDVHIAESAVGGPGLGVAGSYLVAHITPAEAEKYQRVLDQLQGGQNDE